jgi:hypothetical protein
VWQALGTRNSLVCEIHRTTGVDREVLRSGDDHNHRREDLLNRHSAYSKLNWASRRKTTRDEDMAYCLMGLFDVHMPLLYGEGGVKAFMRLQQEIINKCNDQSILLHTSSSGTALSDTVSGFSTPYQFKRSTKQEEHSLRVTKQGVEVNILLYKPPRPWACYGIIETAFEDDPSELSRPAILLRTTHRDNEYLREAMIIFRVQYNIDGTLQAVNQSGILQLLGNYTAVLR